MFCVFTMTTSVASWPFSGTTEVDIEKDGSIVLNDSFKATFINMHNKDMDIYWDDGQYGKIVATFATSPCIFSFLKSFLYLRLS